MNNEGAAQMSSPRFRPDFFKEQYGRKISKDIIETIADIQFQDIVTQQIGSVHKRFGRTQNLYEWN